MPGRAVNVLGRRQHVNKRDLSSAGAGNLRVMTGWPWTVQDGNGKRPSKRVDKATSKPSLISKRVSNLVGDGSDHEQG